jgi:hypothetical protein
MRRTRSSVARLTRVAEDFPLMIGLTVVFETPASRAMSSIVAGTTQPRRP